ncbi:transglycosylase SLT domain-containing protein [Streptomyces sp. NBC_01500]|uniref:transglycosylase SLT domain-containing protein n=1 Tax=Streptomyces sp. NBC_01500 TaxID=2903886 RepID=UPI002257B380|nr:transglycosylase SLT domain-containing protein [Streptomyces sp. NBC_01500]MCX4552265.1 transglycosylase SLT domain-containing protein [Streptomyces sp. NBC_01500]
MNAAKNALPALTPLVKAAADAVGVLWSKASKNLKKPFWQGFQKDIDKNAKPAIVGIGTAFGNVLKGVAWMIDAFLPHMGGIVKESDKVTGRFARWGSSLKGSPAFEKFLAYVKSTAPGLASFIGKVLSSALDLSKAISPLSNAMFTTLAPLFDAISWVSTNFPGAIQLLWGLYAANKAVKLGMLALAGESAAYEIAMAGMTLATAGWGAAVQATGIVPVIEAIVLVIALLVIGVIYAYKHFTWFRVAVDTAWAGIKVATMFLWDAVLKPTFDAIWWALQKVGAAAMWLWKNAIKPAFDFIAPYAKMLFTALVTALLVPAYLAFQALGAVAKWLWAKALSPTFSAIGAGAKWLWQKGIQPWLKSVRDEFTAVGTGAKWLWSKAISPAINSIADGAHWLYDHGIKRPFDAIKTAMSSVSDSFKSGRKEIKKQWDMIQGITKGPVKFVVDKVYNAAIVPLWSAVAKVAGAKPLKPLHIDGYSTGGIRPGYTPDRDNALIAVGGGEAIMRPEWTRAIGAERINAWNAAARSGGVGAVQRAIAGGTPAFADCGIVGWLKDKGSSAANWVAGKAGGIADFFSNATDYLDPKKLFGKVTSAIKDQLKPITTNPWSKSIAKMPVKMLSDLKDKALSAASFGFLGGPSGGGGGSGKIPSGQHLSIINAAMAAAGVPPPGTVTQWQRGMNTLITRESGWNARAINNWDSNSRAGHRSQGLTQTIPGTFNAYVPASLRSRGILDPVANVAASIHYIVARYGNISHVQQADASKPPMGYDSGGWLMPGYTSTYNGTGKPEPVFTSGQWDDISRLASSRGGTPNITVEHRTFIGDRELTHMVRHEIDIHDADTARDLNTGRYV